jgi:hypothetical protein
MMTKVRERLDDVIMDRQACFGLVDDEMLVVKIRPIDLIPFARGVPNREGNEEALGPELREFAICHSGRAHGEREVHPLLGNERNMLPQSAPRKSVLT